MLALANHLPYLEVFVTGSVKIFPLLDFLLHLFPCLPSLPLGPRLSFGAADDLVFIVVNRNVNQLRTAHVVCGVIKKATSNESACCISASEDAVTTTRAISAAAGGNVVDGAIDSEIDRKVWV